MLQDIRSNIQGTMAKIIIGLIVISFSIFGIESILLGGGASGIAEVNGEDISAFEVQQAVNTQKRQLIAMMGESIDPAMLDDDLLSGQALQGIISRRLLMQSANDMKLAVSEREVGMVIAGMEQFQLDGQFSPEMYKSILSGAGYTPASFKQGLVQDLVVNQVRSGLAGSDFATPAELALNATITAEQRDVRYLTLPLAGFRQEVIVADEQIKAWYAANEASFLTEESVELEYIELVVDNFREPVAEDVLREEFELTKQDYQYQTENRVSHILFEQGDDETDEAYEARIADAQAALGSGEDFAVLAGEVSADIASAATGGDLGYTSGDAFPPEMEEAIAVLEIGQVSEPVATDAGTHLILLTDRRAGENASFEDLRPEIEETIQLREAKAKLIRSVDSLRDVAFNAEDLAGPAEKLGLTVRTIEGITRNHAQGLFSNAQLLAAAYSDDVLEQGHNSEVIELSSEQFVALRVKRYSEPELLPLADVRDDVVTAITSQVARDAAMTEVRVAMAAIAAGEATIESFAVDNGYEWQVEIGADRRNANLPEAVLRRAFELAPPADESPVLDYVINVSGDIQLLELARVSEGKLDNLNEIQRGVLERQVGGEYGSLVQQEYQNGLREAAEITIL